MQVALLDNQSDFMESGGRLRAFFRELEAFEEFGEVTRCYKKRVDGKEVPLYVNEFWTSKQRAAHSLHEISYRACFKPQLPRFFIQRLTEPGDLVYDPFMGRGTTLLEGGGDGTLCGGK